jgi:outer membrane biosynthesis protein TonB
VEKSSRDILLEMYASTGKSGRSEQNNFIVVVLLCIVAFAGVGAYLKINNPPPETIEQKMSKIQTRFIIEEKKQPPPIVKKPKIEEKKAEIEKPPEPIDLRKDPPPVPKAEEKVDETPPVAKPVRKVYGLKKIYSTGIGASGDASSAIIGKVGNTLNTEIDTFTATKEELKGQVVSIASVTTYPRLKNQVKPEYTKEMIENRVEGAVRADILIDIDGKVKKVVVLDDLGFGSKQKVYEACLKLEFEPATLDGKLVSVWKKITFRYKLLQS